MAGCNFSCFAVISLFILSFTANGQRLRDNMYESLYGAAACYRRLNGTHQTGCSSKRGGSVGIVHIIHGQSDVDWVLGNGTSGQYAVVLPLYLLSKELLDQLVTRPDVVAGVVVTHNNTHKPPSFSHENRCPNIRSQAPFETMQCRESAPDNDVWNPKGSGLMHRDFPFPIFYLPPTKEDSIEALYECFYKFNSFDLENQSKRSLCAIEMDAFMFAAVNSEVCIRKSMVVKNLSPVRFCDPLADKSVYMTLFPRGPYFESSSEYFTANAANNTKVERKPVKEAAKSVVLVTAAMDATSFLEGEGLGAVSTVSGLVVLLVTAQLLHDMFPANQANIYDKNVLFFALNGESYDMIGSQRLAWDLARGAFPLDGPTLAVATLGAHVHIGQLQHISTPLTAFTPDYSEKDKNDMVNEMMSWMNATLDGINMTLERGGPIPPSPVHSFLRILNSSESHLASAIIADHGHSFSNNYYQSMLDDRDNLGYTYLNLTNSNGVPPFPDQLVPADSIQMRLANISTALGRALYRHVTGNPYHGKLRASAYIVDELLHCHLDTTACPALAAVSLPSAPPTPAGMPVPPPSPLYVGVSVWPSQHSKDVALLAILLGGTSINRTKEDCVKKPEETQLYHWMAGWDGKGHCYRANVNFTIAQSPAFEMTDYDYSSGEFSTWTESVWAGMSLRLLVVPAWHREVLAVSVGTAVAVVSLLLVLWARKHVASLVQAAQASPETDSSNVDC